ncbi:MAG: hypothetical protein JNK87_32280 [Bryobacterales bacterium]|nr:hypothetical protein [Bryobacterales bacterium]
MPRERILRWPDGEARPEALLKEAGITRVLAAPPNGAITDALWPGVKSQPKRGDADEASSASREPWVDANGYRVQYERALGHKDVMLAAEPPSDPAVISPYENVEIALVEARINAGNALLSPDARYREDLRKGNPKALAAWRSLAATAKWLDEHETFFGQPVHPAITMVVDKGEETAELANLAYRRGATPRLVNPAALPKPSPDTLVIGAASLQQAPPAALWDYARAGATVVIDSKPDASWREHKKDKDRTFYSLGKGFVVAYHEKAADPSEYALDLIDLVTHRRRAARTWNSLSSVLLATQGTRPGQLLLHVTNYGSPTDNEVQARVQGRYRKAVVREPGAQPAELKLFYRGTMTEIYLPHLNRVATVEFLS